MPTKILGREPAVFFALLAGILLAVIKFVPFSADITGSLNATVLASTGFATALAVSAEKALPALVGLVQAVFAVFLAYGSPVDESTQAGLLALIAAVGAAFVRQNVYAPLDSGHDDRMLSAYDNGYQTGQDEMARQDSEALDVTRPRETGSHGHTEVMPAVGEIYEQDTKR
jgi:hypothetical protein